MNQERLESYLSTYGQSSLDTTAAIVDGSTTTTATSTPKELAAKVSIIELFTLHILPRNEEWEYAKEFISMSDVLDEERKEVFLQALESIREEKEMGELRASEIQRGKEAEMEKQKREAERRAAEEAAVAAAAAEQQASLKRGDSGEVGGGGEKNGTLRGGKGNKSSSSAAVSKSNKSSSTTSGGRSAKNISGRRQPEKSEAAAQRKGQFQAVANAVRNLMRYIRASASKNPLSFLRLLLFVIGIVMALGRQNVRERVGRITNTGWQKVKGTIGMGVKVSYI